MQERFQQILQQWGAKHWTCGLRRDPELAAWINEQTQDLTEAKLAERVYCAITGERSLCSRGKTRKLKSVVDGWTFCGPTGRCECARAQVARKVSASKQTLSEEEREAIQIKREATNLERYGHINTGQTEGARAAHKAFYSDLDNVRNQLRKQTATMMEFHGVENAAHLRESVDKRRGTNIERYGVPNPMQDQSIAARSLATRLAQGYAEEYYRRNYDRLSARMLAEYSLELITSFDTYQGTANRPLLQLRCVACGRNIEWRLAYNRQPRCLICQPRDISRKSRPELAIFQFVQDKLRIPDLISGDREFLHQRYEIDIFSEEHRVAIEHNGLYWHSEGQQPDHLYHLHKLRALEEKNIRLLTIFGDEWSNQPDIVKSKICHMFKRIEDRRYARKMTISEIESNVANAFYESSHIQGGTRASHHLALFDDRQIVAAMSFAGSRPSQALPERSYELTRFATMPYVTVVGGASRLFQHFLRSHRPKAVISYADRRWSDGGLYRTLGFRWERTNPPSYSYVENYTKRHFRFHFRKDVLESILGDTGDQTEWEIMKALDYDRIWDCGTYRFVWYPSTPTHLDPAPFVEDGNQPCAVD